MGMLRISKKAGLFISALVLSGCAETSYNLLDSIYGGRPGPRPGPQQAQNTQPIAAYEPATQVQEEEIVPTPLPRVTGVPNPLLGGLPIPQASGVSTPVVAQPQAAPPSVVVTGVTPVSSEQGWRIVQPTATQGVYETGAVLQQDVVSPQPAIIPQPQQVQIAAASPLPQPVQRSPLPDARAGRVIYGAPGTANDLARIQQQRSVSLSGEAEKETLLQSRVGRSPELPDYGSLLDGLKLEEPPAAITPSAAERPPLPRQSDIAMAAPAPVATPVPVATSKASLSNFVLPGTSWIVDTVGGVPVVEATDMHFDRSSSTVGGKAPCNNYGAEFAPGANGALTISSLFSTQNGCKAIAVEKEFFDALEKVASYEVTAAADTMVLFDAAGAPVIGLKAY